MPAARRRVALLAGLLVVPVVAGCTSGGSTSTTGSKGTSGSSTATASVDAGKSTPATLGTPTSTTSTSPKPATLASVPAAGATGVNPSKPVVVQVQNGTLTVVTFKNKAGKVVHGAMAANKTRWTSTEALGYGKKYTLTSTATGSNGKSVHKSASFSTVRPGNLTMPYLNTTGGLSIKDGGIYGVGMVVSAHFDEPISDKRAAEESLKVTTAPAVVGSWYWVNDHDVHWRPRSYYPAGTKVTVRANVYGTKVGQGLYGESDKQVSFAIGAKHVSISDDKTHHVKVYFSSKLVRTMPTSMGKGGTVHINGRAISYWTQPGTYTVIGHNNPKIMDSRSYGLPLDKGGYKEPIYWATRISTDGVFLHELKSTIPQQGHRDMSHGCLNLNTANSKWFYKTSQIGDVVTVLHTGGKPLQVWQNGDWSLSWVQWQAGSALH